MLENDHKVLRYAATMVIQHLLNFLFLTTDVKSEIWTELSDWPTHVTFPYLLFLTCSKNC